MTRKIRGRVLLTGPSTWSSTAADHRIHGAIYQPVESITLSTAAISVAGSTTVPTGTATVRPDGVTVITSTSTGGGGDGAWAIRLDQPTYPGARKTVICNVNSTSHVNLLTHSSAVPIDGDLANNQATFTTGSTAHVIELIATSTTRWEVIGVGKTTAATVTFSSSTSPF